MIAKKYGVKDVFDLDIKVRDRIYHEQETHDDYFRLDYLERDKIKQILDRL